MNKTQRYVMGLLFNKSLNQVLLIRKLKPEWQSGLLNGVGGKVEEDEDPLLAMIREFEEEAGKTISGWSKFAVLHDGFPKSFVVDCFAVAYPSDTLEFTSQELAPLVVFDVSLAPFWSSKMVTGLSWLLPMAVSFLKDKGNFVAQIHYLSTP